MKYENGQSLIELLVAMAVFVILIGSISFLILDSYVSVHLAEEITKADFLAQEGLEAVRSIRDNSWSGLTNGSHGIIVSGSTWQFQGNSDVIDSKFTRTITVGEVDPDRKKITSQVVWEFTKDRTQEIQLITYLTNWQKITTYCQGTCTSCLDLKNKGLCQGQAGCSWNGICAGTCTPCENFSDGNSCKDQSGCSWIES